MNFLNHISRILCEKKLGEETRVKDKDSFQMISISQDRNGVDEVKRCTARMCSFT